jgi:hypothetical protein
MKGYKAEVARMAKRPGRSWRLSAYYRNGIKRFEATDAGKFTFDELVVDHWLHVEQMNNRDWWMRIGGDLNLFVHIDGKGKVTVTATSGIETVRK